jgi:hypothetical protein
MVERWTFSALAISVTEVPWLAKASASFVSAPVIFEAFVLLNELCSGFIHR